MTLTGCIGVFLAADLIGFYFLLAVLSVGASGLVLQGEGLQALRASALYLGIALLAEAVLLAGLILLVQATPDGSLLIDDAAAALPNSPWRDTTLILLLIGLGIKAGMVPLHFWMPLAYGAAPIPAAAVMSGAAVKASILAMIRFLPFGTALPDFGHAMAAIGFFGAFYGVAIGITQSQPKVILAYSSVVQISENDLFSAELALASLNAQRYTQVVSVYQAMGGGWVDEADALTPVPVRDTTDRSE